MSHLNAAEEHTSAGRSNQNRPQLLSWRFRDRILRLGLQRLDFSVELLNKRFEIVDFVRRGHVERKDESKERQYQDKTGAGPTTVTVDVDRCTLGTGVEFGKSRGF